MSEGSEHEYTSDARDSDRTYARYVFAKPPRLVRRDCCGAHDEEHLHYLPPPRAMPITNTEDQRDDGHGDTVDEAQERRNACGGYSHENTRVCDSRHASMTRGSLDVSARRRL